MEIREHIEEARLSARIVHSVGKFLDIIPARSGSGKEKATEYVSHRLGIDLTSVMLCGDSANDLDMFEAWFRGIIMENARDELKDLQGKSTYPTDAEYSTDIIRSLEHFGAI